MEMNVDSRIAALPDEIRDQVRDFRRAVAGQLQRQAMWDCRADCIRTKITAADVKKREGLSAVSKLLEKADLVARKAGRGCHDGGEDAMWSYWEVNYPRILSQIVAILEEAWE